MSERGLQTEDFGEPNDPFEKLEFMLGWLGASIAGGVVSAGGLAAVAAFLVWSRWVGANALILLAIGLQAPGWLGLVAGRDRFPSFVQAIEHSYERAFGINLPAILSILFILLPVLLFAGLGGGPAFSLAFAAATVCPLFLALLVVRWAGIAIGVNVPAFAVAAGYGASLLLIGVFVVWVVSTIEFR